MSIKPKTPQTYPQARPVEKFWALCKAEYGKRKKTITNLAYSCRVWAEISEKVASGSGANRMVGIRQKLSKVNQHSAYSVLN